MLRSIKNLQKWKMMASDGEIGDLEDFYFDDEQWTIRYLVVDATRLEPSRRVLVSPMSVRDADRPARKIALSISRDQVKDSPYVDTHKPVSRQHEAEYLRYYQYPYYWGGAGLWGAGMSPGALALVRSQDADIRREVAQEADRPGLPSSGDSHLRSTREVIGYHIRATDGDLGHIDDFLVDDESWAIRYAVVDTSNWWFGRKVLIDPDWIVDVSWSDSKVSLDISRQSVKSAPPYDPDAQIGREWETNYYAHHQRVGYWQKRRPKTATLVSLREHREWDVASADRDPRGWTVVTSADGRTIGRVDDLIADTSTMKVCYLDVDLESGDTHVLLPVEYARLGAREERVTAEGVSVEDIRRLPPYKTLPVAQGYDDAFRNLVHTTPEVGPTADDWSIGNR